MKMPIRTRSLHAVVSAGLLVLALGACRDPAPVTTCCLVVATFDPPSASLAVGDTLPVRVVVTGATSPVTVRWRAGRPDVVRLDTTVAAGAPAILRAVGPGVDSLRAAILFAGQPPYEALVPVSVRARP